MSTEELEIRRKYDEALELLKRVEAALRGVDAPEIFYCVRAFLDKEEE